jgi:3-hydroxyacyl-CoA dehydrogenase
LAQPAGSRAAVLASAYTGGVTRVTFEGRTVEQKRALAQALTEATVRTLGGSADGVDVAMVKGLNYPKGPFAWGREIGLGRVKTAIDNLQAHYGEDRYRASPRLNRLVARENPT